MSITLLIGAACFLPCRAKDLSEPRYFKKWHFLLTRYKEWALIGVQFCVELVLLVYISPFLNVKVILNFVQRLMVQVRPLYTDQPICVF